MASVVIRHVKSLLLILNFNHSLSVIEAAVDIDIGHKLHPLNP